MNDLVRFSQSFSYFMENPKRSGPFLQITRPFFQLPMKLSSVSNQFPISSFFIRRTSFYKSSLLSI
ncbi:hypothetical protein LguiB_028288 [Lonicera macranthoides]